MTTRKEKRQIWLDGWYEKKKIKQEKKENEKFNTMMKALNIPHIYEAIFDGQTDLKRMMELRGINKTFNSFFNHRIYDLFKTTKITTENGNILIHGVPLKLSLDKKEDQFVPFIKCLRDKIQVEPKKLELVGLGTVDKSYHKHVHDGIITMFEGQATQLTELTGLAEICEFGCEKCNKLARHCTEYYPTTVHDIVHGFGGVRHYLKEIKFSDRELFHCAQKLIDAGGQVNITKDISCDHFILTLIDPQTRDLYYGPYFQTDQGVPIEVLNRILENLSPKTFEIKISKTENPEDIRKDWHISGHFTEVQMGRPVPRNAELTRVFENFHLDLTDSENFPKEMESPHMFSGHHLKISNLLFLVKAEIYLVTLPRNFLKFAQFDSNFKLILGNSWSSNSMHQKVDIHFFPDIGFLGVEETKYSGTVKYAGVELRVEIEDVKLKMNKDAPENPFKEHDYIGKKFFIRNPETNCDVNIFCWVERERYHQRYYINQELQRVLPIWFLDGEHGPDCQICGPLQLPLENQHPLRDLIQQMNQLRNLLRQPAFNPNGIARQENFRKKN